MSKKTHSKKENRKERKEKKHERKEKRQEKRKETGKKLKKYLIPPQLYPFIPLMKKYLTKHNYPFDKKSPRDIVFQFYKRFVKKERNFDGESNYVHINDYLAGRAERINTNNFADPASMATIVTAVINFIKTLVEKARAKKHAELAPDERELADDLKNTDDDPKSKDIVERAKKEQEEAEEESSETEKEYQNHSILDRILIALGIKKPRKKRIQSETYYYIAHIENYSDPVIENDLNNPLLIVRERIYNDKTGKYTFIWRSPLLKDIPEKKRKATFSIAHDILRKFDINSLKRDINKNNTEKVFLKLDTLIRLSDTKPVLAAISHILMNDHQIYLLKLIRMFPKDLYTDLYNKILNLKQ
jgi:hypothetical protein